MISRAVDFRSGCCEVAHLRHLDLYGRIPASSFGTIGNCDSAIGRGTG